MKLWHLVGKFAIKMDRFNEFIDNVEKIVRKYDDESDILHYTKPLLKELLNYPESIPKEVFKSRKDRFADNLIYMPNDKIFSVIGSVWLPGQKTPIHDHLSWALIGMYEGEEQETIYRLNTDNSESNISLEKISKNINEKGHITVLGKEGIHRIENISDKKSSSLHIYGIDLGNTKRHTYDPVTGEIGTFLTGYDSILKIR